MSRLTGQQMNLAGDTLRVLAVDIGRTDEDLRRILGCGYDDLRTVAGWLYGTRRADRCREYLVAVPARGGRRPA